MSSCGLDTPLSYAHLDLLSQFHFKPISCKPKHTKECYNFPLLVCPTPSVMGLLMCSNSFSTAVEGQRFLSLSSNWNTKQPLLLQEPPLRKPEEQKGDPFP